VTGFDIDGSMGAAPVSVEMYEPGKVFGLEVAGIAYTTDFLDINEREQSFKYLGFLLSELVEK
jgi:hypothetical protein